MTVDWPSAESSLMGNAWVCSRANDHVNMLCDSIGVRWGGSEGERRAAEYIRSRFEEYGLQETSTEEFEVDTDRAEEPPLSFCRAANGEVGRRDRPHFRRIRTVFSA